MTKVAVDSYYERERPIPTRKSKPMANLRMAARRLLDKYDLEAPDDLAQRKPKSAMGHASRGGGHGDSEAARGKLLPCLS